MMMVVMMSIFHTWNWPPGPRLENQEADLDRGLFWSLPRVFVLVFSLSLMMKKVLDWRDATLWTQLALKSVNLV